MTIHSASEASARKKDIWLWMSRFLCFLMKIGPLKVKIDVCVRYNRIFAYCVPTLCVLRTALTPPEYCVPKGGGCHLSDMFAFFFRKLTKLKRYKINVTSSTILQWRCLSFSLHYKIENAYILEHFIATNLSAYFLLFHKQCRSHFMLFKLRYFKSHLWRHYI